MSANTLRTIVLKSIGHHDVAAAGGTIYPGEQIRLQSDGTVARESLAAGVATKRGLKIAKEAVTPGSPYLTTAPRGTVDAPYAAGDVVPFYTALPGDHLNVRVKAGETIAVGDNLVVEGGGSGLFVKQASATYDVATTPAVSVPVPAVLEALEASGGALGAATLMRCRVL